MPWSPPTGPVFDENWSGFTDWADFYSGTAQVYRNLEQVNRWSRSDVDIDPNGQGLIYNFSARPNHCASQVVGGLTISLPVGTTSVWLQFLARFSQNWTNSNANCPSPSPNLTILQLGVKDIGRFSFKVGSHVDEDWTFISPGFPFNVTYISDAVEEENEELVPVVPNSALQATRVAPASDVFVGNWHWYRVYVSLVDTSEYSMYSDLDGSPVHDLTIAGPDHSSSYLDRVVLIGKRTLGATEAMKIYWAQCRLWTE